MRFVAIIRTRCIRINRVLLITSLFALCCCAHALDCGAPKYKIGQRLKSKKSHVFLEVSIAPDRFNRSDIICLAKKLRGDFPKARAIAVGIYNDEHVARHIASLRAATVEKTDLDLRMLTKKHAGYLKDADTGDDLVWISPEGASMDFSMRLDPNSANIPKCTIPIDGDRCLVQFDLLKYPVEAWWSTVTGSVVMQATIQPNGAVTGVQVKGVTAEPSAGVAILRRAAFQNFSTWYFERAAEVRPITVTFNFRLTGPIGNFPETSLGFALPDSVNITANPPLEGQRKPLGK